MVDEGVEDVAALKKLLTKSSSVLMELTYNEAGRASDERVDVGHCVRSMERLDNGNWILVEAGKTLLMFLKADAVIKAQRGK